MKIRHLLMGTALVLALPFSAQAGTDGLYVGAAGGLNIATDAKAKDPVATGNIGGSGTVQYDNGGAGLLSVGYGFGRGIRAEVEFGYRGNNVSGFKAGGVGIAPVTGDAHTYSLMTNVLYDFNTGTRLTPYLGAGIGVGFFTARLAGMGGTVYDGTDATFAYQGIAGASYALTPNLSLTADYRYFGTTDGSIKEPGNPGVKANVENGNHTITAGVRWAFGAPPPAPVMVEYPAPAAPVVTPDFLVFFDWDKYDITREARKIINDAAIQAGRTKPITIVVTGHTDTTGSAEYNQRLSERRAAAVKNELVLRGINPGLIRTVGKGFNELMVPTGMGVREPSNRRAQIVLKVG